jgi:hypothetical protein
VTANVRQNAGRKHEVVDKTEEPSPILLILVLSEGAESSIVAGEIVLDSPPATLLVSARLERSLLANTSADLFRD